MAPSSGLAPTPSRRWPWQRSLQSRIVLTYSTIFVIVFVFFSIIVGRMVYTRNLEAAEHNLEVEAFLAANALEDPLSGYAVEFDDFSQHEESAEDGESRDGGDDEEGEMQSSVVRPQAPESARLKQVAVNYAGDTRSQVTILDPQGDVVADSHFLNTEMANQLSQVEVQAALKGMELHDVRINPQTGHLALYAAAPVQQADRVLGMVQLNVPMDEITASGRNLLLSMTGVGVLVLILMAGLGIWFSRRLVQPVQLMERTAQAIAGGDLSLRVPVTSGDELGALATAFNAMVEELRQLIQQQQRFVANASHELRTPLTNIKLRTETLVTQGKENPALLDKYLGEIDREADRLARLANVLLDLSRLDEGQAPPPADPVDIRPILLSVGQVMQMQAGQTGIDLTLDLPATLPALRLWPDQLEAILVNLMDNAIKYTPPGGSVQVKVQSLANLCQIRVTDTGQGIPAPDLPHIFDRFYRVDKARSRRGQPHSTAGSGAGLGLSIVKALVQQNQGRIWAESELGQGSLFVVEFGVVSSS